MTTKPDILVSMYMFASRDHIRALRTSDSIGVKLAWRAVLVAEIMLTESYGERMNKDPNPFEVMLDRLATEVVQIDEVLRMIGDGMSIVIEDRHMQRHAFQFDVSEPAVHVDCDIETQVADACVDLGFDVGEEVRYGLVNTSDVGAARLDKRWLPCTFVVSAEDIADGHPSNIITTDDGKEF